MVASKVSKRCRTNENDDDNDDENDENDDVTIIDNHIYFYCEVSRASVLSLQKHVYKQSKKYDHLYLHIHSDGGCAFSGLSAMDFIVGRNITTIAEGMCASAATFILLAGCNRQITKHSLLLIHEITSLVGWTKYSELKTEVHNNDILMEMITSIYKNRTKLSKKEIQKLLKDDKYIDSTLAVEYGLVDSIL